MARNYPPGPPNGLLAISNYRGMAKDSIAFISQVAKRYGDCAAYRLGPVQFFQFMHPDQVHEILTTKSKSFHKVARLKIVLGKWNGNGLVLNEGQSWARQRKLVQPAFHPRRLQEYAAMIVRHAAEMANHWQGRTLNVANDLSELTLQSTGEALFGADMLPVADQFTEAVATLQEIAIKDLTSVMLPPMWWPSSNRRRLKAAIKVLDDFVWNLIHQRRQEQQDRGDLLSTLLSAVDDQGAGMSDKQVRDEAVNLLLGGNETTAVALLWTLYLLAEHPHCQTKLVEEIDQVLAGRPASAADVPRLKYTEMAFKEAMRLYPPAYVLSREVHEPVEIGGYALPRGSQVYTCPFVTQRDPRWFENPTSFQPERFAEHAEEQLPKGAYFPFGAGPRACIGKGFAMMEGVLVLASIFQKLRLSLPPGAGEPKMEAQISLHPRGGLTLVARPKAETAAGQELHSSSGRSTT